MPYYRHSYTAALVHADNGDDPYADDPNYVPCGGDEPKRSRRTTKTEAKATEPVAEDPGPMPDAA